MKAQRGSRDITTLSLTSALVGAGGQRHTPAALSPGKTRYPLYRRLGVPQGRSRQVRKILLPTGIRSPDRPARSLVTILTELSRPTNAMYISLDFNWE